MLKPALQPAGLAADGAVLEQRGPGQCKGPGGKHVGHDQLRGEPAAGEHVGPRDQPGQEAPDHQRDSNGAEADLQRIDSGSQNRSTATGEVKARAR